MNNDPSPANQAAIRHQSLDDQRRELELELIRIQSEAKAARLQARAAELELMIRRMSRADVASPELRSDSVLDVPSPHFSSPAQITSDGASVVPSPAADQQAADAAPFGSWDAVREASAILPPGSGQDVGDNQEAGYCDPDADENLVRMDGAVGTVPRPRMLDQQENLPDELPDLAPEDSRDEPTEVTSDQGVESEVEWPVGVDAIQIDVRSDQGVSSQEAVDANELAVDPEEAEEPQRRRSPAALLVSAVLHVVVLVLLGAMTLTNRLPKDQVSLSASASNPSEVSMETFEIETSEPETSEPTPSETEYELSPIGEMKVTEISPDAPPAPPQPDIAALMSASQMSAASMALKSNSDAKIQFCGVEGGGNHFVYLVDSSGSMGDGFESARRELLQSIDVLQPHQRFYVVFFDEEPDYMRLSDPNQDERRSVYATAENKQALKRWAMQIRQNRGRYPDKPLMFALDLRPDVIFLLSDGEFPQKIEDLLKQHNRVENLFGDSGPISIVHTIGYHSREGESRMRRIAEQNQGQYRHVPKP